MQSTLRLDEGSPYRQLIGVGGIGAGLFFALEGDHTLGRNESRLARQLPVRDYYKLHIIAHYVAVLLGPAFPVLPLGKVGDDQTGERLRAEMAAAGMDLRFVESVPGEPTPLSVCFQYPDGSGGNITAIPTAALALSEADIARAEPLFAAQPGRTIALAAPEAPLAVRDQLLRLAGRYSALRVASFTSAELEEARRLGMLCRVDLLAINEDEAAALTGCSFDPQDPWPLLTACRAVLAAEQPAMRLLISAGRYGVYAWAEGAWDHCPAAEIAVASTAGAGDALLAGTLAGLACGLPLIVPGPPRAHLGDRPLGSALDLGVLLASLSVTSPHTIHPQADAASLAALVRELHLHLADPLSEILSFSG